MKRKTKQIEKPRFNSAGYQVNLKDLNGEPLPNLEKLSFRPFKHGGTRVGAGRKPSGRKPVLLRLSPRVISGLRKEAKQNHKTLSEVAEEHLLANRVKLRETLAKGSGVPADQLANAYDPKSLAAFRTDEDQAPYGKRRSHR
jgi:hypothetical protein